MRKIEYEFIKFFFSNKFILYMNFKVNVQKYNMQMMVYFLLKEYIVQFYWMIKIRIKIINRKK